MLAQSEGRNNVCRLCAICAYLPRPGALVLNYPVVTMTRKTHGGSRDNLLGKTPTAVNIHRCSVEKRMNDHYPPTFVWCGDADKTADPDNSKNAGSCIVCP